MTTRFATYLTTAVLLLGAVALTPTQAADGVQISGYKLFVHNAPPAWNWKELSTSAPVANAAAAKDGGQTLHFSVPESSMPGLNAQSVRIGLVNGFVGAVPSLWLSAGESKKFADDVSPLDAISFGDAILKAAKFTRADGSLKVDLTFDSPPTLGTGWDLYIYIDSDGNADNGFSGTDYLIQNTAVASQVKASDLSISWFEIRPGILKTADRTTVTAWVQNTTAAPIRDVKARVILPKGLKSPDALQLTPFSLRPKEARRFSWRISTSAAGRFALKVAVESENASAKRTQWISVVDERDPKHEYETANGAWLTYPARPTLQSGNTNPIGDFRTLPSKALKRNLFGITAHVYRSTNEEDPFIAAHAIDGKPETAWAGRWWRSEVPFEPEQIRVDLGEAVSSGEIRILPAENDAGAPLGFTIEVSADGKTWQSIADETDYQLKAAPDNSPLRVGPLSWQCFKFDQRPVRYARLTATRLRSGWTAFYCAPYDPYQLRIGEFSVIDSSGTPRIPKTAKVSSIHTAWYNSAETVKKTWPMELASGVKLNRISQWGDKTDWATVEKTKGVYKIDPELDQRITESVANGVDILLTVDYGNNLYQTMKDTSTSLQTWHRGHPFLQCGPTTSEAIEGFANFAAFMATHFKGRIKYYEIWNEENGWFFDDWAENGKVSMVRAYGKALTAAAKAIKKANPDAVVVFGGTAGLSLDFPRIAFEEGAGPLVDVFAFHPYGHPTPEAAAANFLCEVDGKMDWKARPEGIKDYEGEIAAFRELLHKYNPKMQIWADEMNWMAPGEPPIVSQGDSSEITQAKHLARFFAINSWLGCGSIWWSLANTNYVQEWSLIRSSDLSPRASYYSAQYVSTVLDDVDAASDIKLEVIGEAPGDLMAKVYRNGKGEILVGLWRTSSADDRCKPVPVAIRLPGLRAKSVELIDTLYGYTQTSIVTSAQPVTLANLLVGDWPLMVKLTGAVKIKEQTPVYLDKTKPIERRIDDLLPRLTIDEKITQVSDNWGCAGVPRLKVPALFKVECLHGYSYATGSTIFPSA